MAKMRKEIDELAVAKMQRMDAEIKAGKRKIYTEAEIKKKYGL